MFTRDAEEPSKSISALSDLRRQDPRPRQTRELLGDALVELIQDKAFDDITVQDVLDRAGVGRTTFYKHYLNKQDLFLSDVEDLFEGMANLLDRRSAGCERIAPVVELFSHVDDVRELYKTLDLAGKMTDVRAVGIGLFAQSIERRLSASGGGVSGTTLRATSHGLAGALFSLLDWWIYSGNDLSPIQMDAVFHAMVRQ